MSEAIDAFCHWLPAGYMSAVAKHAQHRVHMLDRAQAIPVMCDIDTRLRLIESFPGYRQIPSLASPPIEILCDTRIGVQLARIANDTSAELAGAFPAHFAGFVATVCLLDPEAACAEAFRAVTELGAVGVQIFTNVAGRAVDAPEFAPFFATMEDLQVPIWLHPARGSSHPDYQDEVSSQFEIWWSLGWPYETGAAMARIVFSGILERHPDLKILVHHAGGVIPMLEGRLDSGMRLYGTRTPNGAETDLGTDLTAPPISYFRKFYADTATFGSRAAIECGRAFFGDDHMVFASDSPFDPENGPGYIRATLAAIDTMDLTPVQRKNILSGNLRRIIQSRRAGRNS